MRGIPPPPRGGNHRERKKLSGREKSAGGIPYWRGEIIAIVIVIITGFIGIIINTILTNNIVIPTAPLRSAVASRVILVVVLCDHFFGVDCPV